MAKAKNKNVSISIKNWIIVLGVILGIVFIVLYINKWQEVKTEEKYLTSYLVSTNTISLVMNDIKEISAVLSETPSQYFVYIGYTKDKSVYDFEKKLKPIIDDYDLQNSFYYFDFTELKDCDCNQYEDMAKALGVEKKEIENIPVILYFKDGKLFGHGITSIEDFESLLKNQHLKEM